MPKLKLTVGSLEDVNETHRDLYVERNGKFELDVDGVPELRSALKSANSEAASMRTKYKDLDLEAIEQERAELEELRKKTGPEALEALKNQLVGAHGKEKAKLEAKIASLTRAVEKTLVDAAASQAIAEAKGSAGLLLPHVRSLVKVIETDGQYVPQVVDSTGAPRVGDDGKAFTIKDLVEEMRGQETYGRAFDAPGGSGSGSDSASGGGGAAKKSRSKMSVQEKSEYVDKHGQEAYFKLPY